MALRLITADERLANLERKTTICIFGRAKVGKTSLILTLPPEKTLLLDFESGDSSIPSEWPLAAHIGPIRTWSDALNAICLISGPDPARASGEFLSDTHYAFVCAENNSGRLFGKPLDLSGISYYYVDSITDATRVCMQWAGQQPESLVVKSDNSVVKNVLGQYGLMGREVVSTLKHLQHTPEKSVIFVGGLDRDLDQFKREIFSMQSEGSKTSEEVPYIVDQVITMSDFDWTEAGGYIHNLGKGKYRALVCHSPNPWGLPSGGRRSDRLEMIEPPDLGKLIEKMNRPARSAAERLQTALPG